MAQVPIPNSQASLAMTVFMPLNGADPRIGFVGGGFLGEIGIFAGSFSPAGLLAQGALIDIGQDFDLYNLLGTSFGGDALTTFAIPDLSDRALVGAGAGQSLPPISIGHSMGSSNVTLTFPDTPPVIGGTSEPFDNHQPSLTVNYIINLTGVFPSQ